LAATHHAGGARTHGGLTLLILGAGDRLAVAAIEPTLERRELQDALRAAIATRGGYCWWDVDHAGCTWVVRLPPPATLHRQYPSPSARRPSASAYVRHGRLHTLVLPAQQLGMSTQTCPVGQPAFPVQVLTLAQSKVVPCTSPQMIFVPVVKQIQESLSPVWQSMLETHACPDGH
jgi:hypothetical protein